MGQSIMQMDPVALADIKSEGYMAVAKTGQNGRAALSEFAQEAGCFVEPIIYSGDTVAAGSTFQLGNIENGHSVAMIGLMAPSRMNVKSGDVFELIFNNYPYIGTYPLSMALFRLTGHPGPSGDPVASTAPLNFRRLTTTMQPRALTGICNDGGIGANGNPSRADNPVRFTFEEDADFEAGDNIYVGLALAYSSDYVADVGIMASPLKSIKQFNDPSRVVMPVYYLFGSSSKIDSTGFVGKELTAGYGGPSSGYDYSLSSGFGSTGSVLQITANGIETSVSMACPVQMKLMKVQAT